MVEGNYEWLICFSAYKFPSVPIPDTIKSRPHHRHNLQRTEISATLKYRSTSNHELWEIHHQNIERNHIKWIDQLTSVRLKIDATASAVRIWTNCNQHTPSMNNSQSLRLQKLVDLEFRPFHPEEETKKINTRLPQVLLVRVVKEAHQKNSKGWCTMCLSYLFSCNNLLHDNREKLTKVEILQWCFNSIYYFWHSYFCLRKFVIPDNLLKQNGSRQCVCPLKAALRGLSFWTRCNHLEK